MIKSLKIFGKNWISFRTMDRKKLWKYISNAALIGIILILFIPSWRVAFQGWYQGLFMGDLELIEGEIQNLDPEVNKWVLFDMQSQLHSFNEFGNKPTILSFWATWCSYCRPELEEINELQLKFKNRLNYVSVTEETIESVEKSGLNDAYNFLYVTEVVPDFFELKSYPTLLIINANQQVVYHHEGVGKLNTEENFEFLEGLIQNK